MSWGTGKPLREFLHADDLGEACVFALENWSALSENAPLDDDGNPSCLPPERGAPIDLSIRELVKQGHRRWPVKAPFTTTANQMVSGETTG